MILLIKLDKATYERINVLVKEGKYPSMESFLELAIRNQFLLEGEEKLGVVQTSGTQSIARVSETLLSIPSRQPKSIGDPTLDERVKKTPLWGQINRLSPLKIVLRVLANCLVSSEESTADLKRFSAEAAEKATEFRLFAKKKDKTSRTRGEYLHVGFPKKDPFSQQRFLNYYVGKAPLQKWTDSVLVGLSLANIKEAEDGSRVIGLTESGSKFVMLNSPLIDEFFLRGGQIKAPLSKEEVSFLLDHIRSYRSGEFDFLVYALGSVKNGADTPTKLKGVIMSFLKGREIEMQLSEKVGNTMQVGVIGRLVEMGLLEIKKDAQKSKYLLTERVEELVGKL